MSTASGSRRPFLFKITPTVEKASKRGSHELQWIPEQVRFNQGEQKTFLMGFALVGKAYMNNDSLMAFFYSVLTDNCSMENRDLMMPENESTNRIDCGPKLANLRRYWRDYYVAEPSRSSESSVSEGGSPDCIKVRNCFKYLLLKIVQYLLLS